MITNQRQSEKAAKQLLKKYYLKDTSNIDLLDILANENIFYSERKIKSSLGSLIRYKNQAQILISSNIKDDNQKRFVISHELGHWVLHQNMPLFNCNHSKFKYWDKKINIMEKEANWFAGEFLMPQESFKKFCSEKLLSSELIKSISQKYKTSLTAASIRFANYGNDSIMVIFSKNKEIGWYYSSKDFPFSFYEREVIIPTNSLTYDCFLNREYNMETDISCTKDWFYNDYSVEENKYLNEIVFYMPNLNACLTILWQHESNFS